MRVEMNCTEKLRETYPLMVETLLQFVDLDGVPNLRETIKEILDYNVPHGKKIRAVLTMKAYEEFAGDKLNEDGIKKATALGWAIELTQAAFLVADDIMDGSETRRGQSCWYQLKEVGKTAFLDAVAIQAMAIIWIEKYFQDEDYLDDLLELFLEVCTKTVVGQSLDLNTNEINNFSMDRYKELVKNKTSYYTFVLPLRLGMILAGVQDPETIEAVTEVALDIGEYFQAQDDFLDCYGDPVITGKIGTDIEDGKCSWLFAKALELCNSLQKELLKESYGSDNPKKVEVVKDLYEDLDVAGQFGTFEGNMVNKIRDKVTAIPNNIPNKLFMELVEKMFQRRK